MHGIIPFLGKTHQMMIESTFPAHVLSWLLQTECKSVSFSHSTWLKRGQKNSAIAINSIARLSKLFFKTVNFNDPRHNFLDLKKSKHDLFSCHHTVSANSKLNYSIKRRINLWNPWCAWFLFHAKLTDKKPELLMEGPLSTLEFFWTILVTKLLKKNIPELNPSIGVQTGLGFLL